MFKESAAVHVETPPFEGGVRGGGLLGGEGGAGCGPVPAHSFFVLGCAMQKCAAVRRSAMRTAASYHNGPTVHVVGNVLRDPLLSFEFEKRMDWNCPDLLLGCQARFCVKLSIAICVQKEGHC